VTYQWLNGVRQEVATSYKRLGSGDFFIRLG
jgi:hypothetical protein